VETEAADVQYRSFNVCRSYDQIQNISVSLLSGHNDYVQKQNEDVLFNV